MKSLAPNSTQHNSLPECEEMLLTTTVIVCTRNRPNLLRRCLEGIAQLEHHPDEVIVIDNSPGDKETEELAQKFECIYIVEPKQGLSRARNRGLAESKCDVVAYLDDDATPDVHWLGLMLESFQDPQVTAVTGKIITPDSPVSNRPKQSIRSLSNKDPEWFEIATFGGLGLGSNMAFRKQACAGRKIFDERLGRGAPFEIGRKTTPSHSCYREATLPFTGPMRLSSTHPRFPAISSMWRAIQLYLRCFCSPSSPSAAWICFVFFFGACGTSRDPGRATLQIQVKSSPADGACC